MPRTYKKKERKGASVGVVYLCSDCRRTISKARAKEYDRCLTCELHHSTRKQSIENIDAKYRQLLRKHHQIKERYGSDQEEDRG